MALGTNANVVAGMPDASGGLWVHPDGIVPASELPVGGTELSESGFIPVGFVSEDGVTESVERDTEKVKAWGGSTIKVLQNDFTKTYSFTLVEAVNPDVLRLIFGDSNVSVEGDDITVKSTKDQLPHLSWVIEIADGDKVIRKVVGDAQITEQGDITWVHSAIIQFEVTLECFEDANGAFDYEYVVRVSAGGGESDGGAEGE